MNDNSGAIHFGSDDKLYVAVGDTRYSPESIRSSLRVRARYVAYPRRCRDDFSNR